MELLIARNPDTASTLPFLMLVPVSRGLVFRVRDTWPRTSAVYCHPVGREEWPAEPELVERVPLRACERRGAAIDLVADRAREHRSQLVFTVARGREVVFWQAPRTRRQARPAVRVPTARAAGVPDLQVIVDARERYPYRFAGQQVATVRRALACGDYAVEAGGRVVASVERKSLDDLISSLSSGRLRYALAELASIGRAAVVVEDRYSRIFAQDRVRPALVADGLAELQVRWPTVPLVFCETRSLAEEWTYRYLAAAYVHALDEAGLDQRLAAVDGPGGASGEPGAPWVPAPPNADRFPVPDGSGAVPAAVPPTAPTAVPVGASVEVPTAAGVVAGRTAEIRRWARAAGLPVADRGRLGSDVLAAWARAQQP